MMDISLDKIRSCIRSPCDVCEVKSCGEISIHIVLEYDFIKIRDCVYNEDRYDVMRYLRGENYCADFPSSIVSVPKSNIYDYIERLKL